MLNFGDRMGIGVFNVISRWHRYIHIERYLKTQNSERFRDLTIEQPKLDTAYQQSSEQSNVLVIAQLLSLNIKSLDMSKN